MTSKFAAIILLVLVMVSGSEGWRRRRSGSPPTNVQTQKELTLSALAQRSEKVRATGRGGGPCRSVKYMPTCVFLLFTRSRLKRSPLFNAISAVLKTSSIKRK